MKCAIMQPTFFPWAGYFNLIHGVGSFVFLDDAQYERGTWHNRNRVLMNGEAHWLTVPVVRGFLGAALNEVQVDDKLNWRRRQLALLQQVYARAPYGSEMLALVTRVLEEPIVVLAELNMHIIEECCEALGIGTPRLRASALSITGKRSERLVAMCAHLRCDEYVSPPGSLGYLAEDGFTHLTRTRLLVNEFTPQPYPQATRAPTAFVSHLSIIDVVANLGWHGAATYIKGQATHRLVESTA
jgi:WbqC-like protein family